MWHVKPIAILCILFYCQLCQAQKNLEFPLREKYSTIPIISLNDLSERYKDVVIVDVRSKFEFDTLHILNAVNVPVSNMGFVTNLKKLSALENRDFVFYCNGITCEKSYLASDKALKNGIKNVYTFDAGVLIWSQAFPNKTVLLGEHPIKVNDIISQEKFEQHLLSVTDFEKSMPKEGFVFDIRDRFQREHLIFDDIATSLPLDNFYHMLKLIDERNTPIYIFDAVGKQVRWVQYFLEKEGFTNYYFLEGGVRQYLLINSK